MAGIANITKGREEEKANREYPSLGRELWLKDKDVATVTIIPTGEESDGRLDHFYMISPRMTSDQGKTYFPTILCENGVAPAQFSDARPAHKFAFWVYVENIIHAKNDPNKDWEEKTLASGNKQYVETVNDFMVFSRGFGRGDYLWNQVVEINDEQGALNKNVVRIKRTGDGMQDTIFSITATDKAAKLPKDLLKEADELPTIIEFYTARSEAAIAQINGREDSSNESTSEVPANTADDDDDNLF